MERFVVIMHEGVSEEEVKPQCIITKTLNHHYNMKFASMFDSKLQQDSAITVETHHNMDSFLKKNTNNTCFLGHL